MSTKKSLSQEEVVRRSQLGLGSGTRDRSSSRDGLVLPDVLEEGQSVPEERKCSSNSRNAGKIAWAKEMAKVDEESGKREEEGEEDPGGGHG